MIPDDDSESEEIEFTEAELMMAILSAKVGYAPELVRYAPSGHLQVWYAVDQVCNSRGWNWSKKSPTPTYCKIYAHPEGANEPYARIDFDTDGLGNPEYFNFFDSSDLRTRDKWVDASTFIRAVDDLISIGLGYGEEVPFLESELGRLVTTPEAISEQPRNPDTEWVQPTEKATTKAVVAPVKVDPTALEIRAKQLGVRRDTLLRWERILHDHLPKGLTQAWIAELEDRDVETIKGDYKRMREKGLLPALPEKPTPKLTP